MWTIFYRRRYVGTVSLQPAEIMMAVGPWLIWDTTRRHVHVTRWDGSAA
jgi:hypothetical protein